MTEFSSQNNSGILNPDIPLSLYIHTPWCIKKCPYCDFNSHTLKQALPEKAYIEALIADLETDLPKIENRPIISIFIGGGTPSLFSPSSLGYLLKILSKRIQFKQDIEITLEANPSTVEQERFKGFLEAGINRLSIGIQSFNETHLKILGRIHGSLEAHKAIEASLSSGFRRVNLDIMYGLPHQTCNEALSDIKTAVSFQPEHLSWYQLTLEENTPFYHHPPPLPHDETCWEIQTEGQAYLQAQDYSQYEVSAYAQKEAFCRHNVNYWEFGDYLGIGAGSCSKLTDKKNQTVIRTLKKKHPHQYLHPDSIRQKQFIAQEKIIPLADLPLEFMMNALRLKKPLKISLFQERTGLSFELIEPLLEKPFKAGWMRKKNETLELTQTGYLFLNDVIEIFIPHTANR